MFKKRENIKDIEEGKYLSPKFNEKGLIPVITMDQKTKEFIDSEININEVCLFMKGTPDAPQCGFSMAVCNVLKILEVKFKGINVLENNELRQGIKEYSEWPTIPQLYMKKEFIGGCDIIKEMYENGELKKILQDKNLSFKKKLFA